MLIIFTDTKTIGQAQHHVQLRRQPQRPLRHEQGSKAKAQAPKRSYTLGGQSKAAQQRQRERQDQLRKRGDDFYAAAEALMPPQKTGFAALMAKQPNPLLASSEYGKAADAYATAGLNEKRSKLPEGEMS